MKILVFSAAMMACLGAPAAWAQSPPPDEGYYYAEEDFAPSGVDVEEIALAPDPYAVEISGPIDDYDYDTSPGEPY